MAGPPILQYTTVSQFDQIYEKVLNAPNLGIWRPQLPAGASFLGDYAQGNNDNPGQSVLVVTGVINDDPASPALKPPVSYAQVWLAAMPPILVAWAPVAPDGYVACGSVGTWYDPWGAGIAAGPRPEDPSLPGAKDIPIPQPQIPGLVCVRYDLCEQMSTSQAIFVWNNSGDGASFEASMWQVPGLNTMVANTSENSPPPSIWAPRNLPAR